ncbi:PREDICTED: ferredoxin-thioredoxin reductase, variable chain-like [Ipomoea nil]|uniref:ferredoxin-thioredoxin reductase, variable chain-like n=1 Tax=Ipomoea nil TaxID=35883 RepID=UPI0009009903|nr:PREDICTED: ferredoxin-thioredoxin reductase, variable chain-like [Ipomoea nil]
MTTSSSPAAVAALFSSRTPSLLISNAADPSSHHVRFRTRTPQFLSVKCSSDSATVVDNSPGPSANSLRFDEDCDETAAKAIAKIGSKVRVTAPLKVYHVPKVPEFDLTGRTGVLKQYAALHKGKPISANLPYKVEFVVEGMEGRKGPLKFVAHLREDEFEFLD